MFAIKGLSQVPKIRNFSGKPGGNEPPSREHIKQLTSDFYKNPEQNQVTTIPVLSEGNSKELPPIPTTWPKLKCNFGLSAEKFTHPQDVPELY